jgi:hypothetical protein
VFEVWSVDVSSFDVSSFDVLEEEEEREEVTGWVFESENPPSRLWWVLAFKDPSRQLLPLLLLL